VRVPSGPTTVDLEVVVVGSALAWIWNETV
jgi:hypothetical protein